MKGGDEPQGLTEKYGGKKYQLLDLYTNSNPSCRASFMQSILHAEHPTCRPSHLLSRAPHFLNLERIAVPIFMNTDFKNSWALVSQVIP